MGEGDRGEVRREDKEKKKSICIHQETQTLRLKGEAEVHSPLYLPSKAKKFPLTEWWLKTRGEGISHPLVTIE